VARSLLDQINDVVDELARQPCDGDSAAEAMVRCNLMVRLWSLHLAQATKDVEAAQVRAASTHLAEWEKRRGEILKTQKVDVFRECLRRMDEMTSQAARLNRIRQQEDVAPWALPS
jgi:hypothetical protein